MAADQLTCAVTCPQCDESIPMSTSGRVTGQGEAEIRFDTSAIRAHIASHQPKPEVKPLGRCVQIISDGDIWPTIYGDPQRFNELLGWLRANGINPNDIPTDSTLSIEPADDGGHLIRCTAYLRNAEGRVYADVDAALAAQEERTVPLAVPLPDSWPQPVAPIQPGTPLAEDHGTVVVELGNAPEATSDVKEG